MLSLTHDAVIEAMRTVQEPELGRDLIALDMVKNVVIDGSALSMTIELTTPACPLKDEIERTTNAALGAIGATNVDITWGAMVRRSQPRQPEQLVPGVKNIIAVASGKGGVGKSTVSVNLAVALAQSGASVGLLDADITGPNIPLMMGLEGQPKASANNKITPLERYGVKAISIQFFVPEGQPIVWRGPLVGGAIQQFLRDVEWGELDYLVIDLDPEDISFDRVIEAALVVQEILEQAEAMSVCKTSGKTGLHIYIPLGAQYTYEHGKQFGEIIARLAHRRLPKSTSLVRSPTKRQKKVYLDFLQNRQGQTLAAPYSVRPIAGAPVSTPLSWAEVKPGLNPLQFTIRTMLKRLDRVGDLWRPVLSAGIDVIKCLDRLQRPIREL
jgi:Mrp family chromosome partitioning ATPase